MKNIQKWKKEYETLSASDELKERVKTIMRKENKKRNHWKGFSTIAACAIVVFTVTLHASPSFANTLSDVPVVSSIVKVLTLNKYEVKENGYEAKIVIPKLEGLKDKELEKKINEQLQANANELISDFEEDMAEMKEEFGNKTVHMGLESDYIIKTDTEDYYALDVYIFNVAGSSSTVHTFYNINKKTGEFLTLKGLFQQDADYVAVLSDYIRKEMIRQNQEEEGMFWIDGMDDMVDGFSQIAKDQDFYINSDGNIVISFDKYTVAAGAQGCPEFVIPRDVVKDIVKPY